MLYSEIIAVCSEIHTSPNPNSWRSILILPSHLRIPMSTKRLCKEKHKRPALQILSADNNHDDNSLDVTLRNSKKMTLMIA
jgi:hypothetical protein